MFNWFRRQPYGIQSIVGYFVACLVFRLGGNELTTENCLLLYIFMNSFLTLEKVDKR